MFLIGEESILLDQPATDPVSPSMAGPGGGVVPRRPARSPRTPGSLHGARGLALVGLGTGMLAILAALELGGGGGGGPASRTTSSSRPPLITRSAAGMSVDPTAAVHPRVARPVGVHRRSVVKPRPRRPGRPARSRPTSIAVESEREPTATRRRSARQCRDPEPAGPQGPPATQVLPAPEPAPAVPPGGGRPGGRSFGFER